MFLPVSFQTSVFTLFHNLLKFWYPLAFESLFVIFLLVVDFSWKQLSNWVLVQPYTLNLSNVQSPLVFIFTKCTHTVSCSVEESLNIQDYIRVWTLECCLQGIVWGVNGRGRTSKSQTAEWRKKQNVRTDCIEQVWFVFELVAFSCPSLPSELRW